MMSFERLGFMNRTRPILPTTPQIKSFMSSLRSLVLFSSLTFSMATLWTEGNVLSIDTLGKEASEPVIQKPNEKNLLDQITVNGLLIVEAWNDFDAQQSDLLIDTAQVTFSGRLTNEIKATVEWLYEEPVGNLELNLAKIEWDNIQGSNFSLVAGQDLLPFGFDTSEMLTDPMAYALGELYKTALGVHYHFPLGQAGMTIFKGDADASNQNVDNFILSLAFKPCKGFRAQLNYLSDLQESTAFEKSILPNVSYNTMPALNAHSQVFLGDLTLSLDIIKGLDEVKTGLVTLLPPRAIPLAWSTEASLGLSEMTTVALTLEGSEDMPTVPDWRFGAVLRHTLHKNFAVGFELLRSEYEHQSDNTTATAQLEISF